MSSITLWHNPRCSTSRETLDLLRREGVEPAIVEYLETPPTVAELTHVLALLGIEPRALVRTKEVDAYRAAGLDDPTLDHEAVVAAMVAHPVLIERPIAIRDDRAVLARPPERVIDLL